MYKMRSVFMERMFSLNLNKLRKDAGLSQKEAAHKLGISQALLSHYENGIRECGLDFLVRAADFYNVTTDFLLGRTSSKTGFNEAFDTDSDIPDDSKLSTQTVFRACALVKEYQAQGTSDDSYELLIALALFNLIINKVNAGELPESWLCGASPKVKSLLQNFIIFSERAFPSHATENLDNNAPVPESIKTIVRSANAYLYKAACGVMPYLEHGAKGI